MFKVLCATWNCFGTPQNFLAVVGSLPTYQARFVSRVMQEGAGDPEILCVQELLSRDARKFFDHLEGFDTKARETSVVTDSTGLGIATRLPVVKDPTYLHFTTLAAGVDALVKKGAMHLRVKLQKGPELDVINTHLQAGGGIAEQDVRSGQLAELGDFVKTHSDPSRALLVVGDFNIQGLRGPDGQHGVEYARLKAALPSLIDLGAFADIPTVDPRTNTMLKAISPGGSYSRLDYLFFRPANPNPSGVRATSLHLMLTSYLSDIPVQQWQNIGDVRPCPPFASDHFGFAVTLGYDPDA